MKNNNPFSFEISLSVLNHLGRNLYRSFITVLGEAISNSWDADAENVWIYIDKENGNIIIKDDGIGMTDEDFQNKFLKIGYSKRKDGSMKSHKKRAFIGRKGIGKLALLSCAEKITVISKTKKSDYIGGTIDNSALDKAITDDLTPKQYLLGTWNPAIFKKYTKDQTQGTIIYFENIRGGVRNSLGLLKKIIALYFRFSLIDNSFNIYIDGERITYEHLRELAEKTEFLWNINDLKDPYIDKELKNLKEKTTINFNGTITGFVASVIKPRNLNIINVDERVSIDLFVNGRLRERDILKHIPTARLAENYLYGQIHFNELDDKVDRFTSSREGVVSDDVKYHEFLERLKDKIIMQIMTDWDTWRIKHREDGDNENDKVNRKNRKSRELFNVVSDEYYTPDASGKKEKIDEWIDGLANDAQFNFISYAQCFISENLIRNFIEEKKITLTPEAETEIARFKKIESQNKGAANISIDIRKKNIPLSYLSMDFLANLVDKKDLQKEACLSRDAKEYKPIRDALMHTALLSDLAKHKLTSVYENIKSRVRTLLSI